MKALQDRTFINLPGETLGLRFRGTHPQTLPVAQRSYFLGKYIYIYMYVCMYVCIYIYIYIFFLLFICLFIYVLIEIIIRNPITVGLFGFRCKWQKLS